MRWFYVLVIPRFQGLSKEATMQHVQSAAHDSVPSYVRHERQPLATGTYHPLAKSNETLSPVDFRARRRAALYTHKTPLCAAPSRKSIFTPTAPASAPHISTDVLTTAHTGQYRPADSVSPSNEPGPQAHTPKTPATALAPIGHGFVRAGQATAKAAKTTTRTIRTAATKVRAAWRTFTSFKAVQLIVKFFKSAHSLWKKRMKFSYTLYTVVLLLLTTAETLFMEWTVIVEPTYSSGTKISHHRKLVEGAVGQLTTYVTNMWLTDHNHLFIVNFVGLALIYLVLIFVLNRFWLATLIFGVAITAFGVANKIKMTVRSEPIIPADFSFISGGNANNILSFVPTDSQAFVDGAILVVKWFTIICIALFIFDRRRKLIYCSVLHPISCFKNIVGNLSRIAAAIISIILLLSFTWNLTIPTSSVYLWAKDQGYKPQLFSPILDAQTNGPATTFLSLTNVKVMNEPDNYNKQTMKKIADKYKKEAISINQNRQNRLTDSTVIMVLSESFSDPLRAPRVSYSIDPMPQIRAIKEQTTSGLMLSPGYGGGTANIEYQEITGLSLSNFSDSMSVPYQQLVPNQKNPYAFNQLWTQRYGIKSAEAVHPYAQNMYLRHVNYEKFGFNYLYTDDSKVQAPYRERIDNSPYIDDDSAYKDIIDLIKKDSSHTPQFLQLITMQNHTPYDNWYSNNEFQEVNNSNELSGWEKDNTDTYAKGISYTDSATAEFLNSLNSINRPITVVFYGDHSPGIYPNSLNNKNNDLPLHETDYFIWSNAASPSAGTKLDPSISSFTSPNYFMALAATHMNAKVTPYLALLTKLSAEVPAMGRISFTKKWDQKGTTTYLDSTGNIINSSSLSKKQQELLHDYKLVQYDMTAGKNYLSAEKFNKE